MKYLIFVVSFLMARESLARTLTLSAAQSLAAQSNPQRQVLEAEIAQARARLAVTSLHSRPIIGLAGGGQFEGAAGERDLLPLAYAYTGVNVYNGGQTQIMEKIAGNQIEKAQIEIPYKELQLRKSMEELFAEIEVRNRMISVKRKELKAFEAHRRKANERRRAGLTGDADVLEFELRSTSLSSDIETLTAERKAFFRIVGLLTGETEVDRIQGYELPETMRKLEITVSALSDISLKSRILAKELSGLTFEEELQAANRGPRVDVEGRAGFLPKEGDAADKKARFDVMIVARLDLFNSAQRNAERHEIQMKKKTLEAVMTAENVELRLMIDQSLTALQNLQQKLKIIETNGVSAERYYRSTLKEYERGVKNSPDVAHATEMLFETEYKSLNIRYNWAMQKIRLETLLMRDI
jgi:outer membrane protein TolC